MHPITIDPLPRLPFAVYAVFAAFLVALLYAVARWSRAPGAPPARRKLFAAVLAWLAFTGALTLSGALSNTTVLPPRLVLVLGPATVAVVLLSRARAREAVFGDTSLAALTAAQLLRVGGGGTIVMMYLCGLAPAHIARTGGTGDILVGLTAPLVACLVARRHPLASRVALAWNVLGMLDLLHTVTKGTLSAPTPFQVFTEGPANVWPMVFPFVYVPAFVAPLGILLHIVSLARLAQERRAGAGLAAA